MIVLTLILFFPAIASVPAVVAQDEVMEFVIAYPSDLGELNPLYWQSERSHWYDMCVYDYLLSYDDNLELIPWLAEAFSVSTDGLEVTFTLREGATWHDSQPVTPQDVKFTFDYIRAGPADTNGWSLMQHVTDVTVVNYDIIVTLDQVINWAVDVLGSMPILPKHIREGIAADDTTWDDHTNISSHIGSGMFKFIERVPDEFTLLERFDDWWGPDNSYVGQLPNIERLRIDVVRGQDARILAMRNGDADSELYEVVGAYVNIVLNAPELQLITGAPTVWSYRLGMNTTIPGLDDFEVRKAIAYAIDRQELINIGRLGFGTAITSIIPDEFYPELYHPDGDFPEQNITHAKQILDAAGWNDTNTDGVRDKGGVDLSYNLWTLSWDDVSVGTGTGLKLQLEEIGFEINLMMMDADPLYEGIFEVPRTFEMFAIGLDFDPAPHQPWTNMHSENIVNWGGNPYGWVNSTLDDILNEYRSAAPSEISAAARAVQIAATENMPYVPLYLSEDTHALRAEWTNFSIKLGGSFTTIAPETMVFMYDSELGPSTLPEGPNPILLAGVGIGAFVVGIACTYIAFRRR
ncbi:MAG: ABC transporter substrate-binding protein [Candidatus Thorarchaeota archaeon]|jgi:peptide/nickel transport system substrate-binding protein